MAQVATARKRKWKRKRMLTAPHQHRQQPLHLPPKKLGDIMGGADTVNMHRHWQHLGQQQSHRLPPSRSSGYASLEHWHTWSRSNPAALDCAVLLYSRHAMQYCNVFSLVVFQTLLCAVPNHPHTAALLHVGYRGSLHASLGCADDLQDGCAQHQHAMQCELENDKPIHGPQQRCT